VFCECGLLPLCGEFSNGSLGLDLLDDKSPHMRYGLKGEIVLKKKFDMLLSSKKKLEKLIGKTGISQSLC
jgi:hypothetical protein